MTEIRLESLRRVIPSFFRALSFSIDRPFRGKTLLDTGDRDEYLSIMMSIEEAKIRYNTYFRSLYNRKDQNWESARYELISFVDDFLARYQNKTSIFSRNFRSLSLRFEDEKFHPLLLPFAEDDLTVGLAIMHFRNLIAASSIASSKQKQLNFENLGRIVPYQQVAPIKFDIINNRIVVKNQSSRPLDKDRSNAQSAVEHIRTSGEDLIENLNASNCDRRLLESLKKVHEEICSGGNIVKIGLMNISATIMSGQFKDELPNALAGMINSYNANISLYINQFPDWEQFTHNAAIIDLDESEIEEIYRTSGDVINSLQDRSDIAASEVPKTIKFVQDLLSSPGLSSKRAAFALLRSIENLISSIMRYFISFCKKTAEKTSDKVSEIISSSIGPLIGVAMLASLGVASIAVRVGAPWINEATEIVANQLKIMKIDIIK